MSAFKKGAAIFFLLLVGVGTYLGHYYSPRSILVTITGISSKRMEAAPVKSATADPTGVDVYFVTAKLENGKALIFRNEDTNWGLPLYFKFNSAEIQSHANALVNTPAIVRYYGWRNKLLGIFPNVLGIDPYTGKEPGTHWLRVLTFAFWWTLCLWLFPRYWRFVGYVSGQKENR